MLYFDYSNAKEFIKEDWTSLFEKNKGLLPVVQKGEKEYSDSLGWLDTEKWASDEWLDRITKLAKEIKSFADTFVVIGVGGSNNSCRSVIEALDIDGLDIVYAGNTLSPYTLSKMLDSLEGKSVAIDCIAKNFETLEPGSSFRILRSWLEKHYGKEDARRRIYVTGSEHSSLDALANEYGWTFLPFPDDIGGRFTALSPVHLLPLAVAGADIYALKKGSFDMERKLKATGYEQNDAYRYAALRNYFYQKGLRVELLSCFEPRMGNFASWWEQLFAESEGKDKKGIFPVSAVFSEQLHSLGQFIQDGSPVHFETFLKIDDKQSSLVIEPDGISDGFAYLDGKDFFDINKAAEGATILAHSEDIPVLSIGIDKINEYSFGELFYFFEFSCYLSCKMMGVNPFNQEGVEDYKRMMFKALGK